MTALSGFSKTKAICFTKNGAQLCARLSSLLQGFSFALGFGENKTDKTKWTEDCFAENQKEKILVIFVGALGICVRTVAPFLRSKTTDPAVLCIDEKGTFVISVLSGHIGGANKAASAIAKIISATPIITTATDINGKDAIDTFAVENNMTIVNPKAIKTVNAKILRDEPIKDNVIITHKKIENNQKKSDEEHLYLIEKSICIGVGCRKNTKKEVIIKAVEQCLFENDIDTRAIFSISSIDIKKNETGLIESAKYFGVPFLTFSKDELNAVSGSVSKSDFVTSTVGVDCVCERAALCAAESSKERKLIAQKKTYEKSVTVALVLL